MSYRRRASKRYDARRAAKLWRRTAKSLREGKGIPPKTPYYPNPYGEPIVKPEALRGLSLDPATAMVTAGFYLFGPHWPRIYEEIEVEDKRGRRRKLPSNLWKGYELMSETFSEENPNPQEKKIRCPNCGEAELEQHRRREDLLVCPLCWHKYKKKEALEGRFIRVKRKYKTKPWAHPR